MTHRHEWETGIIMANAEEGVLKPFAFCLHCDERLNGEELKKRANATECLTAGQADTAASLIRGHTVKEKLKDYCKTRRGEK